MIRYWLFKFSLLFRSKKRQELKKLATFYRGYFSKALLQHQVDTLGIYDPGFRAEIPKNPETLRQIKIFRP